MSYLIANDYLLSIQAENLGQVTRNNPIILDNAEDRALEYVRENLRQKYLIDQELADITLYDPTKTYKATQRVYINAAAFDASKAYPVNSLVLQGGFIYLSTVLTTANQPFNPAQWTQLGTPFQIFFAVTPQPDFDDTKFYSKGDRVFWKDGVYTCVIPTTSFTQEQIIQYGNYNSVPAQNIFPDDPVSGVQYWGATAAYLVPALTSLLNTTFWTPGDNRCSRLVGVVVDLVIYETHSNIAPRNIPELRVKRYDDAIKWLKAAAKGEITPNLVTIKPRSGGRIRYGGNVKNSNTI